MFSVNQLFCENIPFLTIFCKNVGDEVEVGDLVSLVDSGTIDKYYDKITIPNVKLANKNNEDKLLGVVVKIGAKVPKEDPYKSINANLEKIIKSSDTREGIERIKNSPLDVKKIDMIDVIEVALIGVVENCKTNADKKPIHIGEPLIISEIQGYAEKSDFNNKNDKPERKIGYALGNLDKGRGKIPILLMR